MKKRGFLMTAAAIAMGSLLAVTAQADSGSTTIWLKKNSSYIMTVPATTTVLNYGETSLVNGLNVSGSIDASKSVVVTVDSGTDGFKFVHESRSDKNIPYVLKFGADAYPTDGLNFTADEIEVSGGETKDLSVSVTQENWAAAPAGNYSDVVTFTAEIQ